MTPENQPTVSKFSPPGRKPKLLVLIIILILIAVALVVVLGRQNKPAPTTNAPAPQAVAESIVTLNSDGLNPQSIKVNKNSKVTWINQDQKPHQIASDPHPTNSQLPGLVSTTLTTGDSYSYVFTDSGTFTYHDHLDPLNSAFQGTVIVE